MIVLEFFLDLISHQADGFRIQRSFECRCGRDMLATDATFTQWFKVDGESAVTLTLHETKRVVLCYSNARVKSLRGTIDAVEYLNPVSETP